MTFLAGLVLACFCVIAALLAEDYYGRRNIPARYFEWTTFVLVGCAFLLALGTLWQQGHR